jgi:hypothetical protein
MAMNRIPCPECGASLKSPTGFAAGQTVCCPKCEAYFAVEEPAEESEATEETNKLKKAKPQPTKATTAGRKPLKAATLPDDDEDDEEEEQPKKKKKKKKRQDDDDDDKPSYKNSPLRFVVLAVLVVTMLVLGYFLYDKRAKERADKDTASNNDSDNSMPQPITPHAAPGGPGGLRPQMAGPGMQIPPVPGGLRPPGVPIGPNPKLPNNPGGPVTSGGLLSSVPLTADEKTKFFQQYKKQLAGTWKADLGDGVTAQLVYSPNGQVTKTITSSTGTQEIAGTWNATGVVSRKGLLVTFIWNGMAGNKPVELIFEEDELQHPVLDPILNREVIGIFRKA